MCRRDLLLLRWRHGTITRTNPGRSLKAPEPGNKKRDRQHHRCRRSLPNPSTSTERAGPHVDNGHGDLADGDGRSAGASGNEPVSRLDTLSLLLYGIPPVVRYKNV